MHFNNGAYECDPDAIGGRACNRCYRRRKMHACATVYFQLLDAVYQMRAHSVDTYAIHDHFANTNTRIHVLAFR